MPTLFTVVQSEEAYDSLASIWLNYPRDRAAITRTSHRLESALRYDPEQQGSPAPPPWPPPALCLDRIPLRVIYRVSEPDRLVHIDGYEYLPAIP